MNMYLLIGKIFIQCYRNFYWGEKSLSYALNWHFKKFITKSIWVSWEVILWGFGCPEVAQMPCWLRVCFRAHVLTWLSMKILLSLCRKRSSEGWMSWNLAASERLCCCDENEAFIGKTIRVVQLKIYNENLNFGNEEIQKIFRNKLQSE